MWSTYQKEQHNLLSICFVNLIVSLICFLPTLSTFQPVTIHAAISMFNAGEKSSQKGGEGQAGTEIT